MNNQTIANLIASTISCHKGIKNCINTIDAIFNEYGNPSITIVNYLKDIVQKEALEAWRKNNCRGLIAMATGTGKSRIPINYMMNYDCTGVMLVVPTQQLRDNNWKIEFEKALGEKKGKELYDSIGRLCYASLSDILVVQDREAFVNTLILDEAHWITEHNAQFFKINHVNKVMALTATVPTDPIKLKILSDLNIPIVYELTLDEAVKLRLVSPYEITIVETELDRDYKYIKSGKYKISEKQAYDNYNKVIDKLEPRINKGVLTNVEGYGFVSDDSNRNLSEKEKKLLDTMIMKRMKVIYNSYAKLQMGKWIRITEYDGNRIIYFCGTIDQANVIAPSYHSKSKSDNNLSEFISQDRDELACVNSLNEGINIPNIDIAVVLQCNSNEKDLVQRLGRILRYRENHIGKMIIIVCKDTVDEKWVNKAIENLDNTKIKRINFANLKVGNEIL